MASALLEELKPGTTEIKGSQVIYTLGDSWVALAVEEDPQGRGIGTLLAGAGERGGGGGAGVLNNEKWGDPMATQPVGEEAFLKSTRVKDAM